MRKLKLIILFTASVTTFSFGQNLSATLAKQFDLYRQAVVSEKIYITTDRQLYLTGELIWFKVFCFDGSFHRPLNISKVAYVEIINRKNQAVLNAKVELKNGQGTGSFFVPTSLSSDNYLLRSYTNWMKNFNPDLYFHKVIGIVNPFVRMDPSDKTKPDVNIEFYPEGGTLVNAVATRIGFKVTSSTGEKLDGRCFLLDEKNDTILHFSPKKGIGSFELTPSISKKYRVLFKTTKWGNSIHAFPAVNPYGYSMKLIDKGEQVEVSITKTNDQLVSEEELILFVHTRNVLAHNQIIKIWNKSITYSLPKKEMMTGVSHFTIFNQKGEPVCQRLFYKSKESGALDVKVDKSSNSVRQRTVAHILNLPKQLNQLMICVSKIDSLVSHFPSDFSEYVSLWSDIHQNFVFEDEIDKDDIMLISSWKRFDWQDVVNQHFHLPYLPEHRGHVVNGIVTDIDKTPKKNINVYLSSLGKKNELNNSISDANGNVSFEMNDFYGSHKLIAQTNRLQDSTSVVTIINPFSDKFSEIDIPELKLQSSDEKILLARSVRMQAQNIFFEELESQFSQPDIDSLPFYGKAEETYRLDDYTRFPLMEEVMREYVPGVVVRKRKDGFNFFVLDKKHNSLFRDTPLILLDGVPIFDADEIMQFDPLRVKQLDVVTSKYFHGNLELPGIVSYRTYTGDLAGFPVRSRNGMVDYEGLQLQRKFYSPTYSTNNLESRIPDPRYLLYWNPSVSVDSNQKAEIEFFTSDVSGTYMVKVEGLTRDGQVVQGNATFVVKDR